MKGNSEIAYYVLFAATLFYVSVTLLGHRNSFQQIRADLLLVAFQVQTLKEVNQNRLLREETKAALKIQSFW